jgi:sugar lactone lactonase YvrE
MLRILTLSALLTLTAYFIPTNITTQASSVDKASVKSLNSIELPADFQYPNGITNSRDGKLYVGSITSGRILRISPNGSINTLFPGNEVVFAATSLRLDEQRNILWGTSPDFLGTVNSEGETIRRPNRIFAIDTRSGKLLRSIVIPNSGFGNDIALDSEGGVYITDSNLARIYYLAPKTSQLKTWAEDERFRDEQIGLAGIARRSDGVAIAGKYSSGELFKVTPQSQGLAKVEEITLERKIENPDGMQFASDGSLILVEGAAKSGNGRLLRINVFSPETEPRKIETLASGIKSPVNLTLAGREIWVTESQIRHRLTPGQETKVPDRFFVRRFILP